MQYLLTLQVSRCCLLAFAEQYSKRGECVATFLFFWFINYASRREWSWRMNDSPGKSSWWLDSVAAILFSLLSNVWPRPINENERKHHLCNALHRPIRQAETKRSLWEEYSRYYWCNIAWYYHLHDMVEFTGRDSLTLCPGVVLMLGQRRRRWTSIKTTFNYSRYAGT